MAVIGFMVIFCGLAAIGLAAVVLAGLIAWPVRPPPELASVAEGRKLISFAGLPAANRFQARDGTDLAYRRYPARSPAANSVAIVVHGSAVSSRGAIHVLSRAIAMLGVETYAVDIRGHGASGTRGDIAYLGQLEHDLADLVAEVRKHHPIAPLTLVGHSAGGGFALRIAGSSLQNLFVRTVLLAPYLGYDAPTSRSDSGGWASANVPRFIALSILRRLGMPFAESLPTIAFAVSANSGRFLTPTYSYRLLCNFAASRDFRQDLVRAANPVTVFAGAADELILPDKYEEAFKPHGTVRLLANINHIGIICDPAAVSVIADEIAQSRSIPVSSAA